MDGDPAAGGREGAATSLRLALYEPDRPHNLGMALRLAACLGVGLDVVEPCGFPLDDRRIRRGALDYGGRADWARRADMGELRAFAASEGRRLILLSTRGRRPYHRHAFRADDILIVGSESSGVPDMVHQSADSVLRVPLRPGLRSLNLVTAAALVLGEALRQTGGLDALAGNEA